MSQVPGVHAVHQLHRDRQMGTSHPCLHHKPVGSKPQATQISGSQLAHRTTGPPDEGCSETVFGRLVDRSEA
jgi:hypothetical protein